MQRHHLVSMIILLSGFLVAYSDPVGGQEHPDQKKMLRQLEQWAETQIGSIDIRGRVVSEDGQPLMGVTVLYFFRELGDVVERKEIKREHLTADGDFSIRRRDISSVNLTIFKEGYYSERWWYGFNEETPRRNPNGFETVEVEIVLEKQARRAPLKKFDGILRADVRGPVSVVEVKRQGSGAAWLWKNGEKRDLDWPHVFLETADTGKAELSVVEYQPDDQRHTKPGLERGWVRFNDPDPGDGFIVHEAGEFPVRPEIGMRKMTAAPELGYQEKLELATRESPSKVYFYCKLHGQYGKGMVSGRPFVAVEEERQVARAAVLIFLNPTGSRDVSYVHD